jgi:hypothetical protein
VLQSWELSQIRLFVASPAQFPVRPRDEHVQIFDHQGYFRRSIPVTQPG